MFSFFGDPIIGRMSGTNDAISELEVSLICTESVDCKDRAKVFPVVLFGKLLFEPIIFFDISRLSHDTLLNVRFLHPHHWFIIQD